MSETVPNEIRDEVMSNILAKPSNQICFDCGSKAPKWSSPYLGIVICYECAARHRSYGTHISFVRSVDLDKWNRKQLKSLEITGNSYTKERFNDLGIPLIGNTYDYNNSLVLKVRQEIADKVKNELKENEYMPDKENSSTKKKEEKINFDDIEVNEEKNNDNEEKEKKIIENKKEEPEEKEEEVQKPQKFQVNSNAKVNNIKVKGKAGKKNKIKKVDFDFDFDSFNDVNFSDFNKKDEEEDNKKNDNFDEIDNKKKEEEKEKEEDNEYYETKKPKKDINKKFANKKAISSEDYAALEDNDYTNKSVNNRIKSMGNTQAISSEDVFGSEGNDYQGESMTDKLKEMALNFTLGAAEKAKELKNKTNDLINRVQNKLGGSGGY